MSIEIARAHLKKFGREGDIQEPEVSTATVTLAAQALGVIPARIAKTISLHREEGAMLVVVAGDAKIDNKKFKDRFGFKPKMLSADEALEHTGHAVGGVCPFGVPDAVDVYLDISMKRFDTVFPACGTANSAIEVTMDQLAEYAGSKDWVDVCKLVESDS